MFKKKKQITSPDVVDTSDVRRIIGNDDMLVKESFFKRFAEKDYYFMMEELGLSKQKIDKQMESRFITSLLFGIIAAFLGFLLKPMYVILGLVIFFVFFKLPYRSLKSKYSYHLFMRELEFWRFIRMVIPFLASSQSLYSIFNEQLKMMHNDSPGSVKSNLKRLMREMTDNPQSVRPFIVFAEKCSGSDRAVLTMSAIFDKAQYTDDMSVVIELGQIATNELFKRRNDIIMFKMKKLNAAPTTVVMSSLMPILAYAVGMIISALNTML